MCCFLLGDLVSDSCCTAVGSGQPAEELILTQDCQTQAQRLGSTLAAVKRCLPPCDRRRRRSRARLDVAGRRLNAQRGC